MENSVLSLIPLFLLIGIRDAAHLIRSMIASQHQVILTSNGTPV